jgi:uncharacterized membrane protein
VGIYTILAWVAPTRGLRCEPWTIQLLVTLLAPALWLATGLLFRGIGLSFAEALAAAIGISIGAAAIFGFVLAYDLSVHVPARKVPKWR